MFIPYFLIFGKREKVQWKNPRHAPSFSQAYPIRIQWKFWGAQLHGKDPISIAMEFKTFGISKGMIWNEIPRDEGSAPTRLSISEFQGAPKSFQKHSPDPRLVEIMENPQGLEVLAQNVLSLEFQDEQSHRSFDFWIIGTNREWHPTFLLLLHVFPWDCSRQDNWS